jgi:pimeloyl-ACP methyl ester carboxylesterase
MPLPLYAQTFGHGPALIVLHGLFGSGTNWRSLARGLSDDCEVHLLDLRNHGRSPHADSMIYPEMADDLRAYMDAHGLEAAAILGHSMGGKVAMCFALDAPGRVTRLVVVDIAPVSTASDHLPYIRAMQALALEDIASREEASQRLAAEVPDPGVRQFLLQNLQRENEVWRWRLNLDALLGNMPALQDFPVDGEGDRYGGPVLFVRGERSDYVAESHRPAVERLFPAAEIVTIGGAGHWVHADQPVQFLNAIRSFLDETH